MSAAARLAVERKNNADMMMTQCEECDEFGEYCICCEFCECKECICGGEGSLFKPMPPANLPPSQEAAHAAAKADRMVRKPRGRPPKYDPVVRQKAGDDKGGVKVFSFTMKTDCKDAEVRNVRSGPKCDYLKSVIDCPCDECKAARSVFYACPTGV